MSTLQPPPQHGKTPQANLVKRVSPVERSSSAYPRKRAVIACQVCRARRTKCDQKKPTCSFCESIGATCVSQPPGASAFDPASVAILDRLEQLSSKVDNLRTSIKGSELGTISYLKENSPCLALDYKCLFPVNIDSILRWPSLQGLVVNFPRSPYLATSPAPLDNCRDVQSPDLLELLNPSTSEEWADDFFQHVHSKNPVLDETAIRRLVRKVGQDGASWSGESCLALLICANGAISQPFPTSARLQPQRSRTAAQSLFHAARRRLGNSMESCSLLQAQCFFFAGVYLMSSLDPFNAWRMFLHALSICQSFGSISRSTMVPVVGPSIEGNSAEESLYWSCWKSERELRCEIALPDFENPALDHPQLYPSLPVGGQDEKLRAWYFYLSEISLWRLETRAKKELSLLSVTEDDPMFHLVNLSYNLVKELQIWQNSLAESIRINVFNPEQGQDNDDILRFVLRGRVTYYSELIFFPYLYMVLHEVQRSQESIPVAQEGDWLRQGLQAHVDRLTTNKPGFYYRHHGTWLMLRSSARSACILLLAARTALTARLLPPAWAVRVQDTIEMLSFWSTDAPGMETVVALLQCLASTTKNLAV